MVVTYCGSANKLNGTIIEQILVAIGSGAHNKCISILNNFGRNIASLNKNSIGNAIKHIAQKSHLVVADNFHNFVIQKNN